MNKIQSAKVQHYFAKSHKFHLSMIALKTIQKYMIHWHSRNNYLLNYKLQKNSLSKYYTWVQFIKKLRNWVVCVIFIFHLSDCVSFCAAVPTSIFFLNGKVFFMLAHLHSMENLRNISYSFLTISFSVIGKLGWPKLLKKS